MNRRNTISTGTKPDNEYPEHLNPFSEENENDVKTNNKFATTSLGRRNSRLTSSFRITSWSIFSSKKSKREEEKDGTPTKTSKDNKFNTITPKSRSQILNVLPPRSDRRASSLGPPYETPRPSPVREPCEDFKLTPKSDRYQSTTRTTAVRVPEQPVPLPEPRLIVGQQPPVPRPRKTLPSNEAKVIAEELPSTSTAQRSAPKITDEEVRYTQQGARPKKKRRAPLPPGLPTIINNQVVSNTVTESKPTQQSQPSTVTSLVEPHTEVPSEPITLQQNVVKDSKLDEPTTAVPVQKMDQPTIVSDLRNDDNIAVPGLRTVGAIDDKTNVVPDPVIVKACADQPTVVQGMRTEQSAVVPTPRAMIVDPVEVTVSADRSNEGSNHRTDVIKVVPVPRSITSRTVQSGAVLTPVTTNASTNKPLTVSRSRNQPLNLPASTDQSRTVPSNTEQSQPAVLPNTDQPLAIPATEATTTSPGHSKADLQTIAPPVPVERTATFKQEVEENDEDKMEDEEKNKLRDQEIIEKVEKLTSLIISS